MCMLQALAAANPHAKSLDFFVRILECLVDSGCAYMYLLLLLRMYVPGTTGINNGDKWLYMYVLVGFPSALFYNIVYT